MDEVSLTPAKVLLLAVHLTSHGDFDGLAKISFQYPTVLHEQLLLRILLTHLPETTTPGTYVPFLRRLADGNLVDPSRYQLDLSPVEQLSEIAASKKAKKLHLVSLLSAHAATEIRDDPISLFLYIRAHHMDRETGLVSHLPELLTPFLDRSAAMSVWVTATVLPFVRRTSEHPIEDNTACSLAEFEALSDRQAVKYLLPSSAVSADADAADVSQILRSIVAPWLYDEKRWTRMQAGPDDGAEAWCQGWDEVLEWLLVQTLQSTSRIPRALGSWKGPADDVDFGRGNLLHLPESIRQNLRRTYARAAMACVYSSQDCENSGLEILYSIVANVRQYLRDDMLASDWETALSQPPDLLIEETSILRTTRAAAGLRSDLLAPENALTEPCPASATCLLGLILSAAISARLGVQCTVRRAAELSFIHNDREQKAELTKVMRSISSQAQREHDAYLLTARRQMLWLSNWCEPSESKTRAAGFGPLNALTQQYIEIEFLKLLISGCRYDLARSIYESTDQDHNLLPSDILQAVVYQCALSAFDNASNPNRTKGSLQKCDDILHAFSSTVKSSEAGSMRIEALLKASHALGKYHLVLKQGEPFRPIVLRVHSDPIMIIEMVLEQNPKAYTRLQEFLETGMDIVRAGLPSRAETGRPSSPTIRTLQHDIEIAEKRITAFCIDAALREDDFETAYSYVVSRLGAQSSQEIDSSSTSDTVDEWSWTAALRAGQYTRTERSQQPTHLGTASGNLVIRHLEQRIECLATALRVAPTSQLQEILKSFRRCEEQLDSAVKEEAAHEAAWDAGVTRPGLPGAYDNATEEQRYPARNTTARSVARQADEAPMSLLDLSRATARAAQRNLTALTALEEASAEIGPLSSEEVGEKSQQRVRKRDQLRDAATGTLVSGVGWLIGANPTHG